MWKGGEMGVKVGADSVFVKGFVQRKMKMGVDEMYGAMRAFPWLDRSEKWMKYRGNDLNRTKFFMTDDHENVRVYGYTGFQHESVEHYLCYKDYPLMEAMVAGLNKNMDVRFNHVIGTLYEHGGDSIGFHSDKTYSWTPGTCVAILSLGASRDFVMRRKSDGMEEHYRVDAGDLFVLGWEDNQAYEHSIPETKNEVGPRISICFRDIQQVFSREEIAKNVKRSGKSRESREIKKELKKELKRKADEINI